jgi:hypothetical protein
MADWGSGVVMVLCGKIVDFGGNGTVGFDRVRVRVREDMVEEGTEDFETEVADWARVIDWAWVEIAGLSACTTVSVADSEHLECNMVEDETTGSCDALNVALVTVVV